MWTWIRTSGQYFKLLSAYNPSAGASWSYKAQSAYIIISYTDYWQCTWAHIQGLCSYGHAAIHEGLYTLKPCIWAHMHCQESVPPWTINCLLFFKWNVVLFTMYSNLPKFPVWSPDINQMTKRMWSVMQRKQSKEPVGSLNWFSDAVLITVMFVSV